MNVKLPRFEDVIDGTRMPEFGRRMREFVQTLEKAFAKLRIDDQIIIGGGAPILKHLSSTATWDPANVANGAQVTQTITVTGAALGDEVTCAFNKDLQGMRLTGYVSAANTVTVVLCNDTGGAINLASGTLRASVWQH
jgi:hypothetical protein